MYLIIISIFFLIQTYRYMSLFSKINKALHEISLKRSALEFIMNDPDISEYTKGFTSLQIDAVDVCIDLINDNLKCSSFKLFFDRLRSKRGEKK